MRTSDFDFSLPKNLIADRPRQERDYSRLCVARRNGKIEHRRFIDLLDYLDEGDLLLLNDTKVLPARIIVDKPDGKKLDILFIRQINEEGEWEVIYKGDFNGTIFVANRFVAEICIERIEEKKIKKIKFLNLEPEKIVDFLWQYGLMPLPPYINRMPDEDDRVRYQTVYAEKEGSIAAPTAGLHFTERLFHKLREKGVYVEKITLHIGVGTFKPIRTEKLKSHRMDPEYFEINKRVLDKIKETKRSKKKVIAVGTTVTRAVEGFFSENYKNIDSLNGVVKGYTDIFIYPGYRFKCVDAIVTNFHLPKSTPLMLISAFLGFENLLKAYNEAISMGYRFFSYGDAMLAL
jgi:S-adenosylmethionine:tRNA ribosyltransferase-isomerase